MVYIYIAKPRDTLRQYKTLIETAFASVSISFWLHGQFLLPPRLYCTNIDSAHPSLSYNCLGFLYYRHINHFAIQGPCSPPGRRSLCVCDHHPNGPLDFLWLGAEYHLHSSHLRRMDTLFPVEAEALPAATLFLQDGWRGSIGCQRLVRRTDQVNCGGKIMCAGSGDNGRASEEKLGQRWGPSKAQIESKILCSKD